ncbi:MAG: bacteriohemerythrin [Planctomycetaceae bacterium]|nr:bacteriohemerythrin [Planctomycetaceae bacterium]
MTKALFKWDESFLIGIEELDHEHKVLIDDINRLHDELTRQEQKSEIDKCLGDIYKRMQAHFALEECVMKEHEYEFYDDHKREHDELLDHYAEYMLQLMNDTGIPANSPIDERLEHWVMSHIVISDKKMSLMIQETESYKSRER